MANRTDPSTFGVAITTSDSVNLPNGLCRGIHVGVGGTITLIQADLVVPYIVVAGSYYPYECTRVNATGTTATDLVALY